jgi:tetratricopeptide (TPR) repeat protein
LNLIRDRPWLGVGAGNFSRAFPRFEGPNAGAPVADPHNFLLEIAATCGVVTLLWVLAALGTFLVRAGRWLFRQEPAAVEPSAEPDPGERIGWEYYIGGMCGLVLGFILRMTTDNYTPAQVLGEGGIACARCFIWLTAFVLFERVAWSGRVRLAALAVGVAAALCVLMVSPGIGLPSVTVPLWAAVALALNALPQPANAAVNKFAAARILPLAVMGVVALLFFLNVFNPVTSCADQVRKAVANGQEYRTAVEGQDPRLFDLKGNRVSKTLLDFVISPLQEAAKDDPDDARVPALLARWTGELWIINSRDPVLAKAAIRYAQEAEKLDPLGRDGYDAEYQLRMEFGRRLEAFDSLPGLALGTAYRIFLKESRWPNPLGREAVEQAKTKYQDAVQAKAKEQDVNPYEPAIQYLEAADVLRKVLPNDPNDAELRFRLADTLFKAWEDDRCREQAREALRLDAAAPGPALTDDQRRKLNVWKDLRHPVS